MAGDNFETGQFRVRALIVAAVAVGIVILIRLWLLQIVNGAEYVALAERNRVGTVTVEAPRGMILDRNGVPLVKNRVSLNLVIEPAYSSNKRLIRRVARLVGMTEAEVRRQIRSPKVSPLEARVIKRDLDPGTVAYVSEHQSELKGARIQVTAARKYPYRTLAAHVLGYTGEISDSELQRRRKDGYSLGDLVGKAGVEESYENILRGVKGSENVEVNAENQPIRVLSRRPPIAGNDLVLSIDKRIQEATEKALVEGMEIAKKGGYPKARAGAAVVMDPNTGEIIAMASYPTYDPGLFVGGISRDQWADLNKQGGEFPLTNRAIMSGYPPGSTFKVVTASAGLSTGVVTPTSIWVCRGAWTGFGGRWKKWCWLRSGHGAVNMFRALTVSCDTYFYELSRKLYDRGAEELQAWSRKYGLGAPTGVDLPGEAAGRVPDKKWKWEFNEAWPENRAWFPGDTVNMGIGQGDILVTPLQLARVYSALVNGGKLHQPRIVKAVRASNRKSSYELPSKVVGEVGLAPEYAEVIKTGLSQVTKTGTAAGVFSGFPMETSGKTGTSEVFGKDDFAFYVGYAPSDKPRHVVAMVIEQGGHGGSAAAPAVRNIFSQIYNLDSPAGGGVRDSSR